MVLNNIPRYAAPVELKLYKIYFIRISLLENLKEIRNNLY